SACGRRPASNRRRSSRSAASWPTRSGLARGGGARLASAGSKIDPEAGGGGEDGAVHRLRIGGGVDDDAALRLGGGDAAEPVAQAPVKGAAEPLETVGRAA